MPCLKDIFIGGYTYDQNIIINRQTGRLIAVKKRYLSVGRISKHCTL
jgi:hypothetical protein